MAKREKQLTFKFENPNGKGVLEQALRKILIDKLAAQQRSGIAVVQHPIRASGKGQSN